MAVYSVLRLPQMPIPIKPNGASFLGLTNSAAGKFPPILPNNFTAARPHSSAASPPLHHRSPAVTLQILASGQKTGLFERLDSARPSFGPLSLADRPFHK